MQDELVDKVLNLIQGEKELREGVIQYIKRREEDGDDECVDELKYLLDYTQWWDWDFTPPNTVGQATAKPLPAAPDMPDIVCSAPSAPSQAIRQTSIPVSSVIP